MKKTLFPTRTRNFFIIFATITTITTTACGLLTPTPTSTPPTPLPTSLPPTPLPTTVPATLLPTEGITILQPAFLEEISGGLLTVSGFSGYFFESNLSVVICIPGVTGAPHQICGTQDNVLAEGYATIESPDIGLPGPFSGELAYFISASVRARVVVYAISPMDGAILFLSSVDIFIAP